MKSFGRRRASVACAWAGSNKPSNDWGTTNNQSEQSAMTHEASQALCMERRVSDPGKIYNQEDQSGESKELELQKSGGLEIIKNSMI